MCVRAWGGGGGRGCTFFLVPLKKIGIFPCSSKLKNLDFLCSPKLPLFHYSLPFFRLLFPCSAEINGVVPQNPWEASFKGE